MFVQFAGKSISRPGSGPVYIRSEEVEGKVQEIIDKTERLLTDRLGMAVLTEGLTVKKLPAVPRFALREAIVMTWQSHALELDSTGHARPSDGRTLSATRRAERRTPTYRLIVRRPVLWPLASFVAPDQYSTRMR